jgi:hypothetical protein
MIIQVQTAVTPHGTVITGPRAAALVAARTRQISRTLHDDAMVSRHGGHIVVDDEAGASDLQAALTCLHAECQVEQCREPLPAPHVQAS